MKHLRSRRRASGIFWGAGLILPVICMLFFCFRLSGQAAEEPDFWVDYSVSAEADSYIPVTMTFRNQLEEEREITASLYVLIHEGSAAEGENVMGRGSMLVEEKHLILPAADEVTYEYYIPVNMKAVELELLVRNADGEQIFWSAQHLEVTAEAPQLTGNPTLEAGNQTAGGGTDSGAGQTEGTESGTDLTIGTGIPTSLTAAYNKINTMVSYYGTVKLPKLKAYLIILVVYFLVLLPLAYALMAYFKQLNYFKIYVIGASTILTVVIFLMGQGTRYDTPFYYYTRLVCMDGETARAEETIYMKLQSPYNGSYTISYPEDYDTLVYENEEDSQKVSGHFVIDSEQLESIDADEINTTIRQDLVSGNTSLTYSNVRSFEEKRLILTREAQVETLPIAADLERTEEGIRGSLKNVSGQTLENVFILTEEGYYYCGSSMEPDAVLTVDSLKQNAWKVSEATSTDIAAGIVRDTDGSASAKIQALNALISDGTLDVAEGEILVFAFADNDLDLTEDASGLGYSIYRIKVR